VSRTHRHVARPADPGGEAGPGDVLAKVLAENLGYSEARGRVLEEFERAYLEKALAESGGNVGEAAAKSGIARRHFQRLRARQK
jgi:DNA-binding NtrC family response regulator